MKNILVTGGAGFIGSNFINYILANRNDLKIVNLDLLTYAGNLNNLKKLETNENYVFIKGSITDQELVEKIILDHSIDGIINFAAESHVDKSIINPSVFIDTNIKGTFVLLEAFKKHKLSKYLQISTDEVYGSLGDSGLFTENTPLSPNSPYSASKASADLLVKSYFETYSLNINITRCSNNYGPYHYPEKLIPLLITNGLNDDDLPIYGDGKNIRDWLYVIDHCKAIELVYFKGVAGEVYNIGGNNEKTNNEIVELIVKRLNLSSQKIKYVADRLGHDKRYAIDSTKIMNDLGWTPEVSFNKGIEKTIKWYLENKSWWEPLRDETKLLKKH